MMDNAWELAALFFSAFLSATLLPGSSEALLLYLLNNSPHDAWQLWLSATLGNTLGGVSNWFIGSFAGRFFPAGKLSAHKRFQTALRHIKIYGSPILLLSWLPIIGDPLCLAAGWLRFTLPLVTLYIFIGKGLRYGIILGLPAL